MSPTEILAPGKLVLVGEYAVLDGAPALVLAVDRGVRCQIQPGAGIETPDGDDRFVRPALEGAPEARYIFSDWNPVDLPSKPGFGGSAAACVAACLAAGRPGDDAYALHRAVQGGGSGLDVAASLHGGLIRFRVGEAADSPRRHGAHGGLARGEVVVLRHVDAAPDPSQPPSPGSGAGVTSRAVPPPDRAEPPCLRASVVNPALAPADPPFQPPLVVIWSGQSAKTGPRVARYLSWSGRQLFCDKMSALVDSFSVDPLAALAEAGDLLVAMSQAADLDYLTPAHARIRALAQAHGGAAKPSGAGGGDIAVALLPDPDAAARFAAACAAEGLIPIPVRVAPGAHRVPVPRDASPG